MEGEGVGEVGATAVLRAEVGDKGVEGGDLVGERDRLRAGEGEEER